MGRVVEHGGKLAHPALQQVAAQDHQRHPGGSEVLLGPGVDQAVALHADRPREDVAGGVAGEPGVTRRCRLTAELGAEDGVVRGEVHVGRCLGVAGLALLGDVGEVGVLGAAGDVDTAVVPGLLHRLLRPAAGDQVVGGAVRGEEVRRQHVELGRGASLQEEHGVVVGDAGQLAAVGLGLGNDALEGRATVAVLEDADSRAVDVPEVLSRLLEDGFGEDRRTWGKVEDSLRHAVTSLSSLAGGRPRPEWGGLFSEI